MSTSSKSLSRREFLKTSALAGTLTGVGPLLVPSWSAGQAPSEKLNIAAIGVGGRGHDDMMGVAHENIVALCDADDAILARAAKQFPAAQTFSDFRVLLEKMGKQIDAVVVGTPDHTHAPAAAMAMRMGKHCYCEKPLTRTVFEARTLGDLARKNKLVTQIGTQIHAEQNYRRVVELVQAGAIGAIGEVHVWSSASYGGQDRPKDTPPCPPNLHWDLWLGPSPSRPYNPAYVPGRWRAWWDFGSGALGDFGCHYMDLPFWALGLRYPTSVEAEGPTPHPETTPRWLIVRYQFPARGPLPPVKLTWYDGGKRPMHLLTQEGLIRPRPAPKSATTKAAKAAAVAAAQANPANWTSGVLFVGAKGMLLADYGRRMLLPESKFVDFAPPPQTIPNSIGHHKEWTQACKTGGPTTCGFDYSGPLSETALLGCVSFRAGSKLDWDAQALKAGNCPKAEAFVRQEYRKGWIL